MKEERVEAVKMQICNSVHTSRYSYGSAFPEHLVESGLIALGREFILPGTSHARQLTLTFFLPIEICVASSWLHRHASWPIRRGTGNCILTLTRSVQSSCHSIANTPAFYGLSPVDKQQALAPLNCGSSDTLGYLIDRIPVRCLVSTTEDRYSPA